MWFYPLLKEFDTSSSSSTKIQVADGNKPDTILEAPDHLLIHSDLSNIKLIDSKIIDLMPKGSYLVNTSRGEVWDEQSVYKNIVNDKLAGVATDVIYEEQKNLEKSILWKNKNHPKILITPHLGGASYDAMWRCELKIQEKFFQNVNMR